MSAHNQPGEELLSQLRLKGVNDPEEVEFAVMEPNGQISVIQRQTSEAAAYAGVMRLLISDGWVNEDNLRLIGRDRRWLNGYLKKRGLQPRDVFMLLSDGGKTQLLYPMKP